ncbi:MAG: hypothetical protein AB1485_00045 [Candidatus Thermoplasmatota archaeon]
MAGKKQLSIRGIDPQIYKRFVGKIVADYGRRRTWKNSYVAQTLNELMEMYADGIIDTYTQSKAAKGAAMIKRALRETKGKKGYVEKEDVDVAVANLGPIHPKTLHSILWYLENSGFFKEMGVKMKVPPLVKTQFDYTDEGIAAIEASKKRSKEPELMYR